MSVNEIIWNFNAFTPVPFGKLSHNFFQIWYTPGISHDQKMQIFSLGMFQNASICGDKLIFELVGFFMPQANSFYNNANMNHRVIIHHMMSNVSEM